MKTAIIAAVKGYTPEQVDPWLQSLHKSEYRGKVFIVLYENEDSALAKYFKANNCHIFLAKENGKTHMATQRFLDYANLLKSEHFDGIEFVIHTDIRDVIFQKDPSAELQSIIGNKHIVASGEGVTYRHEDWNGDGLEKNFGTNTFIEFADYETLCSGIIAGRKHMLIELFQTIYDLSFYSKEPDGFVDQHFYNYAIRKIFYDVTVFASGFSGWAANLGTLIAIPMNSPDWSSDVRSTYNSFERFRKGKYIENMLVPLPIMKDGRVCNSQGKAFAIVHQYDRYEPWKNELLGIKETIPTKVRYQKHVIEKPVIVQIGANDGVEGEEYGFQELLDKTGDFKLFLVEPVKEFFDKLEKVYGKHGDKVTYINKAISSTEGEEKMTLHGGMSKLDKNGTHTVSSTTWNNFISDNEISKIDLLLLDCEGYEENILLGIDFQKTDVKCIRYEYFHIQNKEKVDDHLRSHGYEIHYCEIDPTYNKIAIKK